MRALDFAEVCELAWQLQNSFVGVHVSEVKEIDALLCEDLGHSPDVRV
jgi:hypothetical protein